MRDPGAAGRFSQARNPHAQAREHSPRLWPSQPQGRPRQDVPRQKASQTPAHHRRSSQAARSAGSTQREAAPAGGPPRSGSGARCPAAKGAAHGGAAAWPQAAEQAPGRPRDRRGQAAAQAASQPAYDRLEEAPQCEHQRRLPTRPSSAPKAATRAAQLPNLMHRRPQRDVPAAQQRALAQKAQLRVAAPPSGRAWCRGQRAGHREAGSHHPFGQPQAARP